MEPTTNYHFADRGTMEGAKGTPVATERLHINGLKQQGTNSKGVGIASFNGDEWKKLSGFQRFVGFFTHKKIVVDGQEHVLSKRALNAFLKANEATLKQSGLTVSQAKNMIYTGNLQELANELAEALPINPVNASLPGPSERVVTYSKKSVEKQGQAALGTELTGALEDDQTNYFAASREVETTAKKLLDFHGIVPAEGATSSTALAAVLLKSESGDLQSLGMNLLKGKFIDARDSLRSHMNAVMAHLKSAAENRIQVYVPERQAVEKPAPIRPSSRIQNMPSGIEFSKEAQRFIQFARERGGFGGTPDWVIFRELHRAAHEQGNQQAMAFMDQEYRRACRDIKNRDKVPPADLPQIGRVRALLLTEGPEARSEQAEKLGEDEINSLLETVSVNAAASPKARMEAILGENYEESVFGMHDYMVPGEARFNNFPQAVPIQKVRECANEKLSNDDIAKLGNELWKMGANGIKKFQELGVHNQLRTLENAFNSVKDIGAAIVRFDPAFEIFVTNLTGAPEEMRHALLAYAAELAEKENPPGFYTVLFSYVTDDAIAGDFAPEV